MNELEELVIEDNAPEVRRKSNLLLQKLGTTARVLREGNATLFRDTINNSISSVPNYSQLEVAQDYSATLAIDRLNRIKAAIEGGLTPETPDNLTWPDKLKILVVGNSHSEDAWTYVPYILKLYNIPCFIVLALHRGEWLTHFSDHWDDLLSTGGDGCVDDLYYFDSEGDNYWKSKYINNANNRGWYPLDIVNMKSDFTIGDEGEGIKWNLVCLQPFRFLEVKNGQSYYVDTEDNIVPKVNNAFTFVNRALGENNYVKTILVEHSNLLLIPYLNMIKVLIEAKNVNLFLPVGPAIWKMCALEKYRSLPTGPTGGTYSGPLRNFIAGDKLHLCEGLPTYTAASTIVQAIFKYYKKNYLVGSSTEHEFIPTIDWIKNVAKIPWPNPGPADSINPLWSCGIDEWDDNKEAAANAAIGAVDEINNVIAENATSTWKPATDTVLITIKKGINCNLYYRKDLYDNKGELITDEKVIPFDMYLSPCMLYLRYEPHAGYSNPKECCKTVFNGVAGEEYYPWVPGKNPLNITAEKFGRNLVSPCCDMEYTVTCQTYTPPTEQVEPEEIILNNTTLDVIPGETTVLTSTIMPANATNTTVAWNSSNTAVATVENGIVTAIGPGECNITATCSNIQSSCHVTVLLQSSPEQDTIETITVNEVSFNMVSVEGDTFLMGTPATLTGSSTYERPQHFVTVSDYKIGQTPVTQALWVTVMGSNPSNFTDDLQRPVERVSWNDCMTFITKLNTLTGRSFRLPTEAEWEFAAKGGKLSKAYIFAGSNTPAPVAWYSTNSDNKTQPVAQKAPNELGIYDMSGNVREWCSDWYTNYNWYTDNFTQPIVNPTGPKTGTYKMWRGGSWSEVSKYCRCGERASMGAPTTKNNFTGFRLALTN